MDSSTQGSILECSTKTLDGKDMGSFKDAFSGKKAIVFVNVASKWGKTKSNYEQLVQMYADMSEKGLEIVGVPCNQFGGQEPGTPAEIRAVCDGFGVKFPMTEKLDVKGDGAHLMYQIMNNANQIQWNFHKFLVNG